MRYRGYHGYGKIGTADEIARVFEGIARWELPPGMHVVKKPTTFCVPEEVAPELIRAVEDHARLKGWTLNNVNVAPCDRGSPPGVSVVCDITVPGGGSAPPQTERVGTILGTTLGTIPEESVGGGGDATDIPTEAEKGGTGWIIAGGVLAALALGGGLYLLLRD